RRPIRDARGVRKEATKLFLLLSPPIARVVAATRDVSTAQSRNILSVQAGRMNFKVDLNKLVDVEVVVKVGDKRDTFTLKVGEVS
ncbi:MAG TPA: hypothetical protein VF883_07835, partial [Thermoanaerobaculia bacterium]